MYVYVCILISTQAAKLKQGRGVHTHGGILLRVWPAAYIPVTDIFVISGTCACHKAQSCNKQNSLSLNGSIPSIPPNRTCSLWRNDIRA